MRVSLVRISGNKKTGPIPVSTTEMSSCAERCPFLSHCYASYGHTIMHWKKVPEKGVSWDEFCDQVAALPAGQIWRHNEAGDLPSIGNRINRAKLRKLTAANGKRKKRGFTYTHHELTETNVRTLMEANLNGFTVNVSCETVGQVDLAKRAGLPAVLEIPKGEELPPGSTTPDGHPLRLCPAYVNESISCSRCGICAKPDRQTVIVFPAHGPGAKRVGEAIFRVRAAEAEHGVCR